MRSVFVFALPAHAETLTAHQQLAVQIYKELVEINTVSDTGDTGRAADAMAARLRAAGFNGTDVQVFKPAPRKGNLVARLRGSGARKPILLLAHIDVVAANPADWSLDPFKFTEKDGYFYGRGTSDDKDMAATFVTNLIRYRKEGYKPDRDIIVALTADEEIGGGWGIQWLLKNHRNLIDAEFALNEGGGVVLRGGKPLRVNVQTAEKITVNYRLGGDEQGRPQLASETGQCDLSSGRRSHAPVEIQLSCQPERDDPGVFRARRRNRKPSHCRRYKVSVVRPSGSRCT